MLFIIIISLYVDDYQNQSTGSTDINVMTKHHKGESLTWLKRFSTILIPHESKSDLVFSHLQITQWKHVTHNIFQVPFILTVDQAPDYEAINSIFRVWVPANSVKSPDHHIAGSLLKTRQCNLIGSSVLLRFGSWW